MARIVFARLPEGHRMPHPHNPAIDFPAGGQRVDAEDPVWMQLIADGSLIVGEDTMPATGKRKEKN